jgi:hypothetical protein
MLYQLDPSLESKSYENENRIAPFRGITHVGWERFGSRYELLHLPVLWAVE